MTHPTLYLCGPMTGLPDFNHPLFNAAAKMLRAAGYGVFNPAENGLPADTAWADHMRKDIARLVNCQAIATLPGTEDSKGAQLELHIAQALGMPVRPWLEWIAEAAAAEAQTEINRLHPEATPA